MHQKHIVIIEDQNDLRLVLKTVLRSQHFLVTDFSNGEDAASANIEPVPDVIIVDSGLPGISGTATGAILRDRYSESSPTLAMFTGTDSAALRKQAIDAGFEHFIGKPIDIDSFCQQLNVIIANRST